MAISARGVLGRATSIMALLICGGMLASCTSSQPKSMVNPDKKRSKEYFAESVYGVKASPRVTNKKSNLPRGGGREQLGKPYVVRGKVYVPKEEKGYKKTGLASWYGEAFHGRLTANGEIYDMTHLTGAHPTMPLPSYARVTNLANGSSVIVRINDRGPYHEGRVVDLSYRAAEMLGYARVGTAKVKVEYVGRAPLDGRDDEYLLASYRPGNKAPDPSDGLPTGVMIAMNGATPTRSAPEPSAPFPGRLERTSVPPFAVASADFPELPAFGPIVPERPGSSFDAIDSVEMAIAMSYAPERRAPAVRAFDVFAAETRVAVTKMERSEPFVAAATLTTAAQAEALRSRLASLGRAEVQTATDGDTTLYSVNLYEDGRSTLDGMLAGAWANGAPDAIIVRD